MSKELRKLQYKKEKLECKYGIGLQINEGKPYPKDYINVLSDINKLQGQESTRDFCGIKIVK